MNKLELMKTANEVRKGIVTAVHSAKAGHPGGSLSAADIFTYLYFEEMNIDPKEPKKADRDRFVLSKGHTAPGLYSVLAQRGYFSVEDLKTLRHTGSYLQGHPDMKHIPGVDMSSGSLGQGISAAVGMAIAGKLDNADYRVYTLLGDGEIQEGQVWEAAMLAAHKKRRRFRRPMPFTCLECEAPVLTRTAKPLKNSRLPFPLQSSATKESYNFSLPHAYRFFCGIPRNPRRPALRFPQGTRLSYPKPKKAPAMPRRRPAYRYPSAQLHRAPSRSLPLYPSPAC